MIDHHHPLLAPEPAIAVVVALPLGLAILESPANWLTLQLASPATYYDRV